MRATHLKIENILGLEELEIELGSLTVVQGGNDEGKTSIVESIKALLGGGHDATLIRRGAEAGRIVLVLEDGTEIAKRITADRSTVTVSGVPKKPQAYIDKLVDGLSFNPVAFLLAPPEKQAEWLLELLPIELERGALTQMTGLNIAEAELEGRPLDVLARLRARLYDLRTGVNRVAQDKAKTVKTLEQALPDETPEGVDAKLQDARQKLEDARSDLGQVLKTIQEQAAKATRQAQVRRQPHIEELVKEVGKLEERAKASQEAEHTRKMLEKFRAEQTGAEIEAKALTERLERLDAFKAEALANIPIRGLTYEDGHILKDGIAFERVNKARQVSVALQLAKLRAGELAIACVDNLECLDAETFAEFAKVAPKSGLQLVVTRVTEGPLQISTQEAE